MIKLWLHAIGFHFWKEVGPISRKCTHCHKKQIFDYFYDGNWRDEDEP